MLTPKPFGSHQKWLQRPTYGQLLHTRTLWIKARKMAMEELGGGWVLNFKSSDLSAEKVRRLAHLLDQVFTEGAIHHSSIDYPDLTLNYRVVDDSYAFGLGSAKQLRACASFEHATQSIVLHRSVWEHHVPSRQTPTQCCGVFCYSRLEWLMQVLAHELTHAIVHLYYPDVAHTWAYARNGGHGPLFIALAHRLWGHTTCYTYHGWSKLHA